MTAAEVTLASDKGLRQCSIMLFGRAQARWPSRVASCHTSRPVADAVVTACLQTEQLRLENTCLRGSAKVGQLTRQTYCRIANMLVCCSH